MKFWKVDIVQNGYNSTVLLSNDLIIEIKIGCVVDFSQIYNVELGIRNENTN